MDIKQIEKLLISNGWYPGRKVDISKMEEWYKSEGYELFDTARSFLEEYGYLNLHFEVPRHIKNPLVPDIKKIDIIIDPLVPALEEWVVADINRYYKTTMIPVAEKNSGAVVLCIDIEGKFYAFLGMAEKLGNNFYETIEMYLNDDIPFFKTIIPSCD